MLIKNDKTYASRVLYSSAFRINDRIYLKVTEICALRVFQSNFFIESVYLTGKMPSELGGWLPKAYLREVNLSLASVSIRF